MILVPEPVKNTARPFGVNVPLEVLVQFPPTLISPPLLEESDKLLVPELLPIVTLPATIILLPF